MANAKRDDNYIPTLLAVSNVDGTTPVPLYADPVTHRLLVTVSMTFLDLTDTPSSYSGQSGKVPAVKGTEDGLEFISVPTNPMTTLGDVIYGGASGVQTRLAGNITATKKFLTQMGDGVGSDSPEWNTIAASDIPDISATYETKSNKSTDTALGTSNTLYPSQNAVKAYVDSVAQGLSVKRSVRLATAAALAANVYDNGASGVGATLTGVSVGALTIDGTAVAVADRVLIKDEVTQANNGIYTVTATGSGIAVYILTRATDMDSSGEFDGAFTFVEIGTTNSDSGWVCTTDGAVTVGTTAITFTQFSGAGQITAGNGLTKTGNTLNAVGTTNRIVVAADSIDVGSDVYVLGGTDVPVTDGGTGASTFTDAGVLIGNGTGAVQVTTAGTAGQVLTSNGAGVDPTFQAASGGGTPTKIISTSFENLSRTTNTSVGGGSVAIGIWGINVDTSATISSSQTVSYRPTPVSDGSLVGVNSTTSLTVGVKPLGSDVQAFFGLGLPTTGGSGITFTSSHIGFKIIRSASGTINLYATQADGTTETASSSLTTLFEGSGSQQALDLIIKINGTTSVDYYWRINNGSLSSATNLTTNIPTGITQIGIAVSNVGVATQSIIAISGASYER